MLPIEAVCTSMVCAPAEDHVDVCHPYYYSRPCGYLWFVLLPEAMLMSTGYDKGLGRMSGSMILLQPGPN